jgi:hypothetical protein
MSCSGLGRPCHVPSVCASEQTMKAHPYEIQRGLAAPTPPHSFTLLIRRRLAAMFRRRNASPDSDREAFTADSSDDDDEPERFLVFVALLHQLRRRLLCHPHGFILRMELTRRLSAIPRLAADIERTDPLFVLANLYISLPDAFLERICGRDMLEEFGLVEARRPASPTRSTPPPRSHSPPAASIVSQIPCCRSLVSAADGSCSAPTSGRARRAARRRLNSERRRRTYIRAASRTQRRGLRADARLRL